MAENFGLKNNNNNCDKHNIIGFLFVLFAIHSLTSGLYARYLPGVLVRARNVQHYLGPA